MERVLCEPDGSEITRLAARALDLEAPLVFYPVRHHSPACALKLLELLRTYRPDTVLIEGPDDANALLPALADTQNTPPLCMYCSYDDRDGRVSAEKEKYRAYYPFLAYSPEWIAIREAARTGSRAAFIDMPLGARLLRGGREERTLLHLYENEETHYALNRYTSRLTEQSGCRCFSEFWEKSFELGAPGCAAVDFARAVLALGYYMRLATPPDDGDFAFDRLRERHMARAIAAVRAGGDAGRILVVTGAFHVAGLLEELEQPAPPEAVPFSAANAAQYLMPYTFRETDSAQGYGAGIPFPAYYQAVWERMEPEKSRPDAYAATALDCIVKTARYARRVHPVSLPDEISAYSMARSLAQLRGKAAPGVYELLDGVRSTFVKGDAGSTPAFELEFLVRTLTGMGAGTVAAGGSLPPVVQDFLARCAQYRLKTGTIERQEITLELMRNPAHAQKSRFLHQLVFLETGFCTLQSGPDYVGGRNRNLTREQWTCRYGTGVQTRLTDLSVFGATVGEVCMSLIERRMDESVTAQELGKLMLEAQVMGVADFFERYAPRIDEIVAAERNFTALCALTRSLQTLAHLQTLTDGAPHPRVPELLGGAFTLAARLLPQLCGADEDEERAVCESIRDLWALSIEHPAWCPPEPLEAGAQTALEAGFCNSRVYGVCLAVRYKQGGFGQEEFCARVADYLQTSITLPEQASSFVCGVFLAARDALFSDARILDSLDHVVAVMDGQQFLEMLPTLRYAFTDFLPAELERLGGLIAARHGGAGGRIPLDSGVERCELERGVLLDSRAMEQLRLWGLTGA